MYYTIKFFLRHLLHNPLYLFGYLYFYFKDSFVVKVGFFDNRELFSVLKEQKKSFIRMGDGEIHLILNGDIGYQKYDPNIKKGLSQIISTYSDTSPFVLGINSVDINKTNKELRNIGRLRVWLPLKVMYHYCFPKNIQYGDALIFYDQKNKIYLKELVYGRRIIIVANEEIISNINFPDFEKSIDIYSVVCPRSDAFSEKENIKRSIWDKIEQGNYSDFLVLLACGPASKIIAYELCLVGVQCIDVGVGIELFSIQPQGDLTYRF